CAVSRPSSFVAGHSLGRRPSDRHYLDRLSRAGGNPVTLHRDVRQKQRHWIPAFAGLTAKGVRALLVGAALLGAGAAAQDTASQPAQSILIRNATVHTATARGTLRGADVLVRNGRIAAVGQDLSAAGARVVDAQGKPLTPALFGGITGIGIEEVSGEDR